MDFYHYSARDLDGREVSMEGYRDKVVLLVNTATKCGLTPQYEQLEALYQKYRDRGLEVLDFPCNQFLEQAPGTDEEINSFCQLNYNTSFPRFSKVDVNGEAAHPLFVWLKEQVAETGDEQAAQFQEKVKDFTSFHGETDIKWNFTKFLIDRSGKVVARYSPTFAPQALEQEIERVL